MRVANIQSAPGLVRAGSPQALLIEARETFLRLGSDTPFRSLSNIAIRGEESLTWLAAAGVLSIERRQLLSHLESLILSAMLLDTEGASQLAREVGAAADDEWNSYFASESQSFEPDDEE